MATVLMCLGDFKGEQENELSGREWTGRKTFRSIARPLNF
jgi:hypothetical protein